MSDSPNGAGGWRMPKLSITHFLAIALFLSLALSAYLLVRPEVRAAEKGQPPVQPGLVNPQTPASSELVPTASPDINTMLWQLQEMQSELQAASGQLDQKKLAGGGYQSAAPAAQIPTASEDIAALWAEIERLNQVMQPLMVQLETAAATRSSRSASEMAALRTQVNAIHQRLAYLLARVEAAKGHTNFTGTWSGTAQGAASTNSVSSNQAAYQQLYQSLTELQTLMQQMQSQGIIR